MADQTKINHPANRSRRDFLKASAAAAIGSLAIAPRVHAGGDDILRVGLVGCGGRGCGAAVNALNADPQAKLVAMADLFDDKVQNGRKMIAKAKPGQTDVSDEQCFVGFDGYKNVLAADVDVVLIATASRFHPEYFAAAVAAGKHVFIEKPHFIDAPGMHAVDATCKQAEEKGLCVMSGLCWRYDRGVQETVKRILDGAIGKIVAIQECYLRTPYRLMTRPEGLTELQWQLRNWYHFNWLSGDDVLQSLIHNLDKTSWMTDERPPVSAFAVGGRSQCVEPHFGDQFDHTAICYEYDDGLRVYGFSRAQAGVWNETSDNILGTKGRCNLLKNRIEGETNWQYEGPTASMYDEEHVALFQAIRAGKPLSCRRYMINSTMLGLLGRMTGYTGKKITWEEAINSKEVLGPAQLDWDTQPPILPGDDGTYACPIPGITPFV
ncbi:MAG: Gfo/Idh/MocA family oxidoreductase [Pirellulales bacterium]|jgi:predicted dehydrogenase|nr:Gfo/Idh/MocA family oxidoreductase [Thermoguttaceae bacterium]MDD4787618.1 Gfo/Idh/MocA family oxidoreductase [Pirellulales bacterium]NLZ00897.1 Gfo/Idh/MocA family oxidoreductase [Pirellulaceae bacterium]